MADTPRFGTLGEAPILELFQELSAKNVEAIQFGWGRRGVGGTYTFQQNWIGYAPHREGAPSKEPLLYDAQIWYGNDIPQNCAFNDVARYAQENLFCPFWFFDWCKRYLALLRAYQPAFDATVEAKLVWTTHVAWAINAALGATNLHGSILPSALYEHLSGSAFDEWAGDGSYMYTAQHGAVLAEYWKRAWTNAANDVLAKETGDILLDSGYKVFNRSFEVRWESAWRGGILPVPLETSRFRYDPLISVKDINWRADKWEEKGLAGPYYNNNIHNDPYYIRNSTGSFVNDGGLAIQRYASWAAFTPWAQFKTYEPLLDSTLGNSLDPTGKSLLTMALAMSTLFSRGLGTRNDQAFWTRHTQWQNPEHSQPALIKTGLRTEADVSFTKGAKIALIPLYQPNYELAFRYYYPAMIDLVLACDFYPLISTGINTWWKYNINSGAGMGTFRATEDTPIFDPKTGERLRDKNGIPYGAPIAPPGTVQDQHTLYQAEQERQKSLKIAINLAQTFIAIIQAVWGGNYGALVGAAKSWYDSFSEKFPAPDDSWRGVVPPTPLVQRRIPSFGFVKTRDSVEPVIPDTSGWTNREPVLPSIGGGATIISMMQTVRGYIFALARFGAPFALTAEDRIDLEGIRNPVCTVKSGAKHSLTFDAFPAPGFKPGDQAALAAANSASEPPRSSKGGLLILAFGFTAGLVGVLLSRRSDINLRPWRKRHG